MLSYQKHLYQSDIRRLIVYDAEPYAGVSAFQREWIPRCMENEISVRTLFTRQQRYEQVRFHRDVLRNQDLNNQLISGFATGRLLRVLAQRRGGPRKYLPGKPMLHRNQNFGSNSRARATSCLITVRE
jgi:hypothetical protein